MFGRVLADSLAPVCAHGPCCFIPLVLACLGAAVTVLFACAQAQMILAFDNETCRLCFIYLYNYIKQFEAVRHGKSM